MCFFFFTCFHPDNTTDRTTDGLTLWRTQISRRDFDQKDSWLIVDSFFLVQNEENIGHAHTFNTHHDNQRDAGIAKGLLRKSLTLENGFPRRGLKRHRNRQEAAFRHWVFSSFVTCTIAVNLKKSLTPPFGLPVASSIYKQYPPVREVKNKTLNQGPCYFQW